jgi:ubiquinone/menaquinone biosynthesis C-methylase UbiE
VTARGSDHAARQHAYFERADAERFHWTTRCAGFAETEDALLAPLLSLVESPCLEVGCGEGNNLVRLMDRAQCFGVDLFPDKLAFAARALPGVHLVTADARQLPFGSARFRTVFVRDLLHHVLDPGVLLAEAVRTLAPGGALCLLEPNGRNPVVRLQTHLVPAEAGARASSPEHIAALLRNLPLREVEIRTCQPLPLRRALLHYRFGLPSIGRHESARRALSLFEDGLGRLLPASRWSYVVATARRKPG